MRLARSGVQNGNNAKVVTAGAGLQNTFDFNPVLRQRDTTDQTATRGRRSGRVVQLSIRFLSLQLGSRTRPCQRFARLALRMRPVEIVRPRGRLLSNSNAMVATYRIVELCEHRQFDSPVRGKVPWHRSGGGGVIVARHLDHRQSGRVEASSGDIKNLQTKIGQHRPRPLSCCPPDTRL